MWVLLVAEQYLLINIFDPSPLKQANWASGRLQDEKLPKKLCHFSKSVRILTLWFYKRRVRPLQQLLPICAFLIYLQMTWGGLKVESWKGKRGSQSPMGEAVKSHRCNVWCDTELPAPPGLTLTVTSTKFLTNYHRFTGWSQTVFLQERSFICFMPDMRVRVFAFFCCVSIGYMLIAASRPPLVNARLSDSASLPH